MTGERVGPAGLAVRAAVRRALADLAGTPSLTDPGPSSGPRVNAHGSDDPGTAVAPLVLVACSGGPDSLALAAAAGFVAPRLGLRAGAVVVDHALQPGSAEVAAQAARAAHELGLDPVDILRVEVSDPAGAGPEAAARAARYAALDQAAEHHGAKAVLLGHTRDDQAEAVLLGLLRGSGARSLSGMAAVRGRYRRPLLELPRTTTVQACAELSLQPWADPHNVDPAYTRSRVRTLLAELEERVGAGTIAGLARTAELLRADADALDLWAEQAYAAVVDSGADRPVPAGEPDDNRAPAEVRLDCQALAALPAAVRTRVVQRAARAVGARSADLTSAHLTAVDALVTDWHGQGPVALPGPTTAVRDCGRLVLASPPRTSTEE